MEKNKHKKLKTTLSVLDAKIYSLGSHVSWEEVEIIRAVKNKTIIKKALFETQDKEHAQDYKHYSVELKCDQCGVFFVKTGLNATNAAGIVMPVNKKVLLCETCKQKKADEQEEERKKALVSAEEHRKKELETLLSPDYSFSKDTKYYKKWCKLVEAMPYFYMDKEVESIANTLKSLEYSNFLKTPYWDAISSKKRASAKFRCELCGSGGITNIHHKTYKHHGYEYYYMEDLICLCKECHEKFHDKIGENYVS